MKSERVIGLGCLFLMYPFICGVFWFLQVITPAKSEFLGSEINMSLQKGFADLMYNNIVSGKLVLLSLVIGIGIIVYAVKYKRDY